MTQSCVCVYVCVCVCVCVSSASVSIVPAAGSGDLSGTVQYILYGVIHLHNVCVCISGRILYTCEWLQMHEEQQRGGQLVFI